MVREQDDLRGLTPDTIDILLLDRPELPPSGAGEGSIRPVAAAIGNAIFDATGIRLRRGRSPRSGSKRRSADQGWLTNYAGEQVDDRMASFLLLHESQTCV